MPAHEPVKPYRLKVQGGGSTGRQTRAPTVSTVPGKVLAVGRPPPVRRDAADQGGVKMYNKKVKAAAGGQKAGSQNTPPKKTPAKTTPQKTAPKKQPAKTTPQKRTQKKKGSKSPGRYDGSDSDEYWDDDYRPDTP